MNETTTKKMKQEKNVIMNKKKKKKNKKNEKNEKMT